MARLEWGTPSEHLYEGGVSHGVLFPADGAGVAWNGLVSVDEAPEGGEPSPLYMDGTKYADLIPSKNYKATVTAFSAPAEFGPYSGEKNVMPGFALTRQTKLRFNFSYQTKVDEDHYKIHLVYNVLATPTARTHLTIGEKLAPAALTWDFTTVPLTVAGANPTAHFIFDSRRAPADKLLLIEQFIYGTEATPAFLLPMSTLLLLFGSEAP